MVGSLGVIRAKEEPAAASSTASQSPPRAGSLLAGQGRVRRGKDKCSSLHLTQWLLSSGEPQKEEAAGKRET